jgi:hypothetical protein
MSTLTPKIIMFSVDVGEQHALNNQNFGVDGNATGWFVNKSCEIFPLSY